MRGSSSSTIHNKLSSTSSYLFFILLINILFMQCDFWFKLFELRRYLMKFADTMAKQFKIIDEQQRQPPASAAQQPLLFTPAPLPLPLPSSSSSSTLPLSHQQHQLLMNGPDRFSLNHARHLSTRYLLSTAIFECESLNDVFS